MKKIKLLLPIDGSARSLRTIQLVENRFVPEEIDITMLMVLPSFSHIDLQKEKERQIQKAEEDLASFAGLLKGYDVKTAVRHGDPGPEIVTFITDGQFDAVAMTRSTRGPLHKLGSVTTHIVRNAPLIDILIMHEDENGDYFDE